MEKIKPVIGDKPEDRFGAFGYEWIAVEHPDGSIRCSCGRELQQVDEVTWRCSAGYPEYRLDKDDLMKDKWGFLYIKGKSHDKPK